jgi:hypothetical protein
MRSPSSLGREDSSYEERVVIRPHSRELFRFGSELFEVKRGETVHVRFRSNRLVEMVIACAASGELNAIEDDPFSVCRFSRSLVHIGQAKTLDAMLDPWARGVRFPEVCLLVRNRSSGVASVSLAIGPNGSRQLTRGEGSGRSSRGGLQISRCALISSVKT